MEKAQVKLPNGIPTLRAIRANKAPMTRSAIAAAIGTETKNLAGTLRTLAAMGLTCDVERVPPRPTYAPLVGLTDAGSVAADTGVLPKAPKPVKGRPGRKARGGERASNAILIRCTDAEYGAIAEGAAEKGVSIAEFVRSVAVESGNQIATLK